MGIRVFTSHTVTVESWLPDKKYLQHPCMLRNLRWLAALLMFCKKFYVLHDLQTVCNGYVVAVQLHASIAPWAETVPCYAVLRCAALRCAVLRCATLCCATLCCATLCCAALCYAVLCCAMRCNAMRCNAMPCCATLCCAMLCYAMLCHAMLCHIMLCWARLRYARLG